MFDFEKLTVYQKAKVFNSKVFACISHNEYLDRTTKDQLRRASFSIMLNIAEGSGRVSKEDRSHFFVIARGSTFECVATFDFLKDENLVDASLHQDIYKMAEELSKMLYTMSKNLGGE